MTQLTSCPRCPAPLRPPGLWSSAWTCALHGAVAPLQVQPVPAAAGLARVAGHATVPVWLPVPLPRGWLVTGVASAGDERTGARATAVALAGPSPLGGPADLVFVAEEPGVGLGARLAGLAGPDPGEVLGAARERSGARVDVAGHPAALWQVLGGAAGDDHSVLVGEAEGVWLWALVWPAAADLILLEHFALRDLRRDPMPELDFGALSARLPRPRRPS